MRATDTNKRSILQKVTAFFLAALMLLPGGGTVVYANLQNLITEGMLRLLNWGQNEGVFTIDWDQPARSTAPDGDNTGDDPVMYYDLNIRDATMGRNFPTYGDNPTHRIEGETTTDFSFPAANSPYLESGSIYGIKVDPVHTHQRLDANGDPTNVFDKAGNPSGQSAQEVLYMTNIEVRAEGGWVESAADPNVMMPEITVTWDAPLFYPNNSRTATNVFNNYNLVYQQTGTGNNLTPATHPVDMAKAVLTTMEDGRQAYVYKFNPPSGYNIIPGQPYELQVVPLVRDGNSDVPLQTWLNNLNSEPNKKMRIGGVNYSFYAQRETNYVTVEPFVFRVTLSLFNYDQNNLRLVWTRPIVNNNSDEVDYLILQEAVHPGTALEDIDYAAQQWSPILRLESPQSLFEITEMLQAKKGPMIYSVLVKYKSMTEPVPSNIVEYIPTDESYLPTDPSIVNVDHTPKVPAEPSALTVTWKAFVRPPFEDEVWEDANIKGNEILDDRVTYDIWVTDDLTNFKEPIALPKVREGLQFSAADARTYPPDTIDAPWTFTVDDLGQYYAWDAEAGLYVQRNIEANKVYYVRIVATRIDGGLKSAPAEASHYIPPVGALPTNPNMLSNPPLRVYEEKINEITVEWDTIWYEVYTEGYTPAEGTDETGWPAGWYSKVGAKDGKLYFGDALSDGTFNDGNTFTFGVNDDWNIPPLLTLTAQESAIRGILGQGAADAPIRRMDISGADIQYEAHIVSYNELMGLAEGALLPEDEDPDDLLYSRYMDYINSQVPPYNNPGSIAVVAAGNNKIRYTFTQPALLPDTSYLMLVRPYIVNSKTTPPTNIYAYKPGYVMGMTLGERPPLDITPTAPKLNPGDTEDVWIEVWWNYTETLSYELRWSELVSDYPADTAPGTASGGTAISLSPDEVTAAIANGTARPGPEAETITFRITGLFPATKYYVWAKAIGTTQDSPWSNYVELTTKDLQKPEIPDGLSAASFAHLDQYNKENGTELTAIAAHELIVEWYRNMKDKGPLAAFGTAPTGAEVLESPNFLDFFVVRFPELVANREYYFRVKARITAVKTATGPVSQFSYILQMSETKDFTDYIEVIVPEEPAGEGLTLTAESDWCAVLTLKTKMSDDEYDGNKNPDQYPLPEQDFEIDYDRNTETLTIRFRSMGVGADGSHDNSVDQRFISRLIANKTFTYNVNMLSYEGQQVANRRVELPWSITRAMSGRKISFSITTQSSVVKLPPGFAETPQVNALTGIGDTSPVVITLNDSPGGLPPIDETTDIYAAPVQRLDITVGSGMSTAAVPIVNGSVSVAMNPEESGLVGRRAFTSAVFDGSSRNWQAIGSSYDQTSNEMRFSTPLATAYQLVMKKPPESTDDLPDSGPLDSGLLRVTSKIVVDDMPYYYPNADATPAYVNKLMAAVANGAKNLSLNTPLSDEDYNALQKSGLLLQSAETTVSREAAVNSLVKLYELKTKSRISGHGSADTSGFMDITDVSPQYQSAVLKAEYAGLLTGNTARPKDNLNMHDMFQMIDIIMDESGM